MVKSKRRKQELVPLFTIWVLVVLVWGAYRYFFKLPELMEEMLLKPLVFVGPVIIFSLHHKTRSLRAVLGLRSASVKSILGWGVFFGLLLVVEDELIWHLKGRGFTRHDFSASWFAYSSLISYATAFSEEVLYRGFLLENLSKIFQSDIKSIFTTAALFGIGHVGVGIFTLHYQGADLLLYILMIMVLGLAQGIVYIRTRSILVSSVNHAIWNFTKTFFR